MNKLLLLLFIPFVTFGQDLDFDDIKQIDSEKQFKRDMFEKEFVKVRSDDFKLTYAYGYKNSSEQAQVWAKYYPPTGLMEFQIFKYENGSSNPMFTQILNQVKSECVFYDFKYWTMGYEFACYSCPNSKYKGKIGFYRGKGNIDLIETILFD